MCMFYRDKVDVIETIKDKRDVIEMSDENVDSWMTKHIEMEGADRVIEGTTIVDKREGNTGIQIDDKGNERTKVIEVLHTQVLSMLLLVNYNDVQSCTSSW